MSVVVVKNDSTILRVRMVSKIILQEKKLTTKQYSLWRQPQKHSSEWG